MPENYILDDVINGSITFVNGGAGISGTTYGTQA